MTNSEVHRLRDSAVIAIIDIFGLTYFSLFILQFLLFHFPSSPDAIINSLSVISFSGGWIIWYLSSLLYRTIFAFQGEDAANLQKFEFGGALILIWASTIPAVVLLFPTQPSIQLGYLFAFTMVAVGNLVDFLACDPAITTARMRFPYHCVSLGLLSLVPTIHALTEALPSPPVLAVQIGQFVICNTLGAAFYMVQPLETIGVFGSWRSSLYVLHLVLAYTAVRYSRAVLKTVLESSL
ncbi:Hly-III-related protein [Penicillium hordei]|uniref:Hly-III-related protein n=1 Tax=Penicillium hordei TaxID=40994 RepID=A0AAD6DW87_9EURO|nr:Hly-III-related protein [Penicillium hordei]KAJ5593574.1 Hly-III-related protein [Penicillium hordei]